MVRDLANTPYQDPMWRDDQEWGRWPLRQERWTILKCDAKANIFLALARPLKKHKYRKYH